MPNHLRRELALQISEQFAVLGASLNVRTAVVVGGMDMIAQALELENRPHIVVATPGRIVDHLKSSHGGWDLSRIKFLVSTIMRFRAFEVKKMLPRSWMKLIGFSLQHSHRSYHTFLTFCRKSDRPACSPLPSLPRLNLSRRLPRDPGNRNHLYTAWLIRTLEFDPNRRFLALTPFV